MEGVLAITFIFGGGTLFLLSVSPVGRALAARLKGGAVSDETVRDLENRVLDLQDAVQAALEEGESTRAEITELQERLDFAERLLTGQREHERPDALP